MLTRAAGGCDLGRGDSPASASSRTEDGEPRRHRVPAWTPRGPWSPAHERQPPAGGGQLGLSAWPPTRGSGARGGVQRPHAPGPRRGCRCPGQRAPTPRYPTQAASGGGLTAEAPGRAHRTSRATGRRRLTELGDLLSGTSAWGCGRSHRAGTGGGEMEPPQFQRCRLARGPRAPAGPLGHPLPCPAGPPQGLPRLRAVGAQPGAGVGAVRPPWTASQHQGVPAPKAPTA